MRYLPSRRSFGRMGIVSLLLFAAAASAYADAAWFRSDSLGNRLEAESPPSGAALEGKTGYLLKVERVGRTETDILYLDGSLDTRTVRQFGTDGKLERTTEYHGEMIFQTTEFTATGQPSKETFYSDGRPSTETVYAYREGRPVSSVAYRFTTAETGTVRDEKPAWEDQYLYYPGSTDGPPVTGHTSTGALREVRRLYADGTERISRYDYGGSRLIEEWQGSTKSGSLTRYDAAGRRSMRERWNDGTLLSREVFRYGKNDELVSSKIEDFSAKTVTELEYVAGNVTSESISRNGAVISRTQSKFVDGRLESRRVSQDGAVEEWKYTYGESGKKLTESYYLDGQIVEIIHHTKDGNSYHERYRDGRLVLRTYYEGERRVKEELIRDGQVVRSLAF